MNAFVACGSFNVLRCYHGSAVSPCERRSTLRLTRTSHGNPPNVGKHRISMNANDGRDAEFVLNSEEDAANNPANNDANDANQGTTFDWAYWRYSKIAADINLLPFEVNEVFLPGETKRLHLIEAKFLALFEKSVIDYNKHFAHVVYSQNRSALAAYGTLAYIRTWRRLNVGVLIEIEGTARLRVSTLRRASPYWVGSCTFVDDARIGEDHMSKLRILTDTAYSCVQEIIRLSVKLGKSPIREKADPSENTFLSDDNNGLFVLNEPAKILAWETKFKLAAQRAGNGERFDWSEKLLPNDVAIRRAKALSFAAFEFFPSSPALRQKALEVADTLARLDVVIKSLEEHKKTLIAKQAVLDAFEPS